MAFLTLYAPNPKDGVTTFDKVRFYEATDSTGTGSTLIATVDVDVSTRDVEDYGSTKYTHSTGDTAKYYGATYFNSTSSDETEITDWSLGSKNRLIVKFDNLMGDATNDVFDALAVEQFSENSLEAIFPELQRHVSDNSLVLDVEQLVYTIPVDYTVIFSVGTGDINDEEDYSEMQTSNYKIEGDKLRFKTTLGLNDTDAITIVGLKKYVDIGEVPERYDALMLLNMQADAYDWLASRYPRFEAFSQLQDASKVSFENLRVTAREFRNMFTLKLARLSKEQAPEEYR